MTALQLSVFRVSMGWLGILSSSEGIQRLMLPQMSKEEILGQVDYFNTVSINCYSALFADLHVRLERYFDGEQVDFPDRLDLSGASPFKNEVWNEARSIPYGQTRSYKWIAKRIGQPNAVRAVGQALGANPVPIIIPCHRVLRSDGNLGGFSGGLNMKMLLLHLEKTRIGV